MSANALEHVFSAPALKRAWNDIFQKASPASRKTLAIDDSSLNDFALDVPKNLRILGKEIRAQIFQFQALRPYRIPKPNGKERVICVPAARDRVVQRALVNFLSIKYKAQLDNTISFGFVSDRTVKEAADKACRLRRKYPWVFKTDITSFFDNIDRDILRTRIRKVIREKSLYPILFQVLECEISSPKVSVNRAIAKLGIVTGKGIRQGMPLSPLLSNLFLMPFDLAIKNTNGRAIRYADDLIFLAESEAQCRKYYDFCKSTFNSIELDIPPITPGSKSVIYEPNEHAEFLGLELTGQNDGCLLRVSEKQVNRLTEDLLSFGSISELLSQGITLKTVGGVIRAKRNGYLAAYDVCSNIKDITKKLETVEKTALKKLYRDGLGIDLKKLSAEARTFLGI